MASLSPRLKKALKSARTTAGTLNPPRALVPAVRRAIVPARPWLPLGGAPVTVIRPQSVNAAAVHRAELDAAMDTVNAYRDFLVERGLMDDFWTWRRRRARR